MWKTIMMTPAIGAPADFDYNQLLSDHLEQVFNERNLDLRLVALRRLYNDDAAVIDPDGTSIGHRAISQLVDELHKRFPDYFSFRVAGPGVGLGGVCYIPWGLGSLDNPTVVSGVDVVHIRAGRIQSVYVLIDPVVL
jgi:hypothetical protein